jgi:hypothetical protein
MVPDDNMRHDVDTRLLPDNDIDTPGLNNTKVTLLKTQGGVFLNAKDARRVFAGLQAVTEAAAVRKAAADLGWSSRNAPSATSLWRWWMVGGLPPVSRENPRKNRWPQGQKNGVSSPTVESSCTGIPEPTERHIPTGGPPPGFGRGRHWGK